MSLLFQSISIDEDVKNFLGGNLVLVASGRRSNPSLKYVWTPKDEPACQILNGCVLKDGKLINKEHNIQYSVVPGTNSDWILYEGEPAIAKAFHLLSVGDPETEICDFNTIREASFDQETRTVTIVNKGTINGEPMLESKFNKIKKSVIWVSGVDGEFPNSDFIANEDEDGNSSVNLNTGSSRSEFVKIMFPYPGEVPDVEILSIDDSITAEGVDMVFTDTDPQEEYLCIIDVIGAKGISRYWSTPKLVIPMSKIEEQWEQ